MGGPGSGRKKGSSGKSKVAKSGRTANSGADPRLVGKNYKRAKAMMKKPRQMP
jgi:hypothetical protein